MDESKNLLMKFRSFVNEVDPIKQAELEVLLKTVNPGIADKGFAWPKLLIACESCIAALVSFALMPAVISFVFVVGESLCLGLPLFYHHLQRDRDA